MTLKNLSLNACATNGSSLESIGRTTVSFRRKYISAN